MIEICGLQLLSHQSAMEKKNQDMPRLKIYACSQHRFNFHVEAAAQRSRYYSVHQWHPHTVVDESRFVQDYMMVLACYTVRGHSSECSLKCNMSNGICVSGFSNIKYK